MLSQACPLQGPRRTHEASDSLVGSRNPGGIEGSELCEEEWRKLNHFDVAAPANLIYARADGTWCLYFSLAEI